MNERSDADKVQHWWPGYWWGLVEGTLMGITFGSLSVLNWLIGHCQ